MINPISQENPWANFLASQRAYNGISARPASPTHCQFAIITKTKKKKRNFLLDFYYYYLPHNQKKKKQQNNNNNYSYITALWFSWKTEKFLWTKLDKSKQMTCSQYINISPLSVQ